MTTSAQYKNYDGGSFAVGLSGGFIRVNMCDGYIIMHDVTVAVVPKSASGMARATLRDDVDSNYQWFRTW